MMAGVERRGVRRAEDIMTEMYTAEEVRMLRECHKESLMYRSLPAATLASLGTLYLIHIGKISPRFRMAKFMGSAMTGASLGRYSYTSQGNEKIMSLQNSRLADEMRKGKSLQQAHQTIYQEFMQNNASNNRYRTNHVTNKPSDDQISLVDENSMFRINEQEYAHLEVDPDKRELRNRGMRPSSHLEIDVDRTAMTAIASSGLDDSLRPSLDNEFYNPSSLKLDIKSEKTTVTYDELRRQNRIEYEKQKEQRRQTGDAKQKEYPQRGSHNPTSLNSDNESANTPISYDELRRQNRTEYEQQRQIEDAKQREYPQRVSRVSDKQRPRTNQYGDVLDEIS